MRSPLDRLFDRTMKKGQEVPDAVAVATTPGGSNVAAKKTIKLGIKRDNDFMYYIKKGAVWRVPRKRPGVKAKGKNEKVAQFAGADEMDYSSYLYYLDGNGNVVLSPRKSGGKKKSKKK